jgi:hydrogenase-4 component F
MGTVFLIHGMYASNDPVLHTMNWSELIQHIHLLQRNDSLDFVLLAFFFALAGYGVKAGLAPMHTWLPDAHGEAAPPISALFSGVLIKAAFYAILRFVMLTEKALGNEHLWLITYVLLGAGLFSLTMAVPFILNRKNHFKRVLAYHSLEHMGIILFGTGVGSAVALFGALLHVLNHAITKALMFLAYGNVLRKYNLSEEEGRSNILEPAGVFYLMPVTGLLLAMGGLALVGTPPFNIFLSLWMILWGGVQRWLEVMHTQSASRPLEPYILGISILIFSLATTLIYFGLVQHLARILLSHPPARKRIQEKITELIPLLLLMGLTCVLGVIVLPPLSILIQRSVDLLTLH